MKRLIYLAPLLLCLGCGYKGDPSVSQIQLAIYPKLCVDVLNASTLSGAQAQIYPCGTGKTSQIWTVTPFDSIGDIMFINENSKMCLAVDPASAQAPGEGVIQEACAPDGSEIEQLWHLSPEPDDPGTRIVNDLSGQCLDLPYGATDSLYTLQQYYCENEDPAQGWLITPSAPGTTQ